jgi:hypothetical protein
MKNKSLLITIIVAIVFGAGGFFGGMHYQKSQPVTFGSVANSEGKPAMMFKGGGGSGVQTMGVEPVSGEIISQDDNSITVKMEDGSSKIVILSDATKINKTSEGTSSDLKTGEKVTAFGSANSDGSITAQTVSLGNAMIRMGGQKGNPEAGAVRMGE